jgi:Predicted membrane protein (DUF2254)
MRAHLQYLWYRITASLWLVPGLMIFAAVWLAFAMLYLDSAVPPGWLEPVRWFLRIGPEGARQVLATIAGSMITVASLVFSMTLVTLTLASSQLGPRLITRFMRDTVNQVVLGTYAPMPSRLCSRARPEPWRRSVARPGSTTCAGRRSTRPCRFCVRRWPRRGATERFGGGIRGRGGRVGATPCRLQAGRGTTN